MMYLTFQDLVIQSVSVVRERLQNVIILTVCPSNKRIRQRFIMGVHNEVQWVVGGDRLEPGAVISGYGCITSVDKTTHMKKYYVNLERIKIEGR